ncbi:MAG: PglD-related sugar-binding protein, partial [Candidatus Anammoxibacter sp.]
MKNKKRLLIISAGNFGREVLGWVIDITGKQDVWEIAGFLDDRLGILDSYDCPVGIIGDPNSYQPQNDDLFVCAIGDTAVKLKYCDELQSRGARFTTLIHPTVIIGPGCNIGEGCILCPNTTITTNVTIGDHVILNLSSTVGHDVVIGDGCTMSNQTDVNGHARLGKGVFIGSHGSILPGIEVGEFATV